MFEQLRQRLSGETKVKKDMPTLELLRPDDVNGLRLGWNSHFSAPGLKNHLERLPDTALWARGTNEFIIGDQWRKRPDILQIVETNARLYRNELVQGLEQQFRRDGVGAIIIGNDEQADNPRLYYDNGFYQLEHIVYYEKPNMITNYRHEGVELDIEPFTRGRYPELMAVDNAAFPWLWWNNQAEFDFYLTQEQVYLYMCFLAGSRRAVGYFGFTMYDRWAHLDRLAAVPDLHGQGVGAYQLMHAIGLMARLGARRVTLSTQLDNVKSQRLYERMGFHRLRSQEHNLIGKWLR